MDRSTKEAFVADFSARLSEATLMVVSHYRGLTVAQMEALRTQMRENGASVQVAKNRLVKIAAKGTPFENAEEFLTGPSAVAVSADPVAAARVAHKFAKDNEQFIIVGGALGDKKLSAEEVAALAKLPSLEELRAKLLGTLNAPASKLVRTINEPASSLARVLAAKAKQGEAQAA